VKVGATDTARRVHVALSLCHAPELVERDIGRILLRSWHCAFGSRHLIKGTTQLETLLICRVVGRENDVAIRLQLLSLEFPSKPMNAPVKPFTVHIEIIEICFEFKIDHVDVSSPIAQDLNGAGGGFNVGQGIVATSEAPRVNDTVSRRDSPEST